MPSNKLYLLDNRPQNAVRETSAFAIGSSTLTGEMPRSASCRAATASAARIAFAAALHSPAGPGRG